MFIKKSQSITQSDRRCFLKKLLAVSTMISLPLSISACARKASPKKTDKPKRIYPKPSE